MRRDNKRRRTFRHKTIPSRLLRHKDTDKRQGPCVTPSLKRAPKMPAPLAYRLAADSRHDGEMTFFLSFRAPVSLIPDGKGMGSFPTAGRSPRFTPPLDFNATNRSSPGEKHLRPTISSTNNTGRRKKRGQSACPQKKHSIFPFSKRIFIIRKLLLPCTANVRPRFLTSTRQPLVHETPASPRKTSPQPDPPGLHHDVGLIPSSCISNLKTRRQPEVCLDASRRVTATRSLTY